MFFFKKSLAFAALLLPLCTYAITGNPQNNQQINVNPLVKETPKLIEQREAFMLAKKAMKSGDISEGLRLKKEYLKDYPLSIYIDYWYLSQDPDASKYSAVKKFIKSKKHVELGEFLKNTYIEYFANHGQFKQVLELFNKKKPYPDNVALNSKETRAMCRFYEASWQMKKASSGAVAFASSLYQRLTVYPDSCFGLMSLWAQKGYLNSKTLLEKFEKAYISNRYESQTRALASRLQGTNFASRVSLEMSLYDNPLNVLNDNISGNVDGHRAAVLAFKRYAKNNPQDAVANFEKFSSMYSPSEAEVLGIKQIIAYNFLSRNSTKEQIRWVDNHLPAVGWSDDLKEMRARRAIWFSEWRNVYALIDFLKDNVRSQINWRYWKGRSALEIGRERQGKAILTRVAKDRSFFGFMAAQELGMRMPFNQKGLSKRAKWPTTVAKNKAVQRFFELNAMGDANASLEWKEIAKTASNDIALLMADWALKTGNVNYAISSIAIGKRWDALSYRFPVAYLDLYKKHSSSQNVSLSFLYGISRQESMMNPAVRSPVGAVGLMQLMPATAKHVSKKNNWQYGGVYDLIVPDNNIRLGSAYLRDMLDKFDNNRILAAAAYNAGPNRVLRWASKDGLKRDAAIYVENIPFNETRKYVQNVILYDVIYHKLLTGKEGKLLNQNEISYRY